MQQLVKCITDFPPSEGIKYDESLWKEQHGDNLVVINCFASKIFYPEHWTPLSLKFAFGGKEYYQLNHTTYAVSDSNFLILNQGQQYESFILSENPTESLTLNYTQENINQLFCFAQRTRKLLDEPFSHRPQEISFVEKLYKPDPFIRHHVQQLKALIGNRETGDQLQVTEILFNFLLHAYKLNTSTEKEMDGMDASRQSTRRELYTRLTIAKDYLHSCYEKNITLQQLSETCFMNSFYLLRQFKKQFGKTPHQYLTDVRLTAARQLLLQSDKSVNEIISHAGFADATSFGKLFRRKFGNSPGQYRKSATDNSVMSPISGFPD